MGDQVTAEEVDELGAEATSLILNIMAANAKHSDYTATQLMHGYRNAQLRAEATINAIRWNVRQLFKDGYQPSESAIIEAIWPSYAQIEDFMEPEND